ncbi:MAG: DUF4144 family protein [Pseudomonadota bacterium]
MIHWPAIIKSGNDDELHYVAGAVEWQALLRQAQLQLGDTLIDSQGRRFTTNGGDLELLRYQEQLTLEQVLDLVRQHASVCGHCCVSKMGAPGIAQAVAMVGQID